MNTIKKGRGWVPAVHAVLACSMLLSVASLGVPVTYAGLDESAAPSPGGMIWHDHMVRGGAGYWSSRFPVVVTNTAGEESSAGTVVELVVGRDGLNLANRRAESIRVVGPNEEKNKEHVFYLHGPSGRRTGSIANGDILEFAVDRIPSGESRTFWVYADNPSATDLDEFLEPFSNGNFTDGDVANVNPARWFTQYTDDLREGRYLSNSGPDGSPCVHLKVRDGLPESDYVLWEESGVRLLPGRRYTLRAKVRYDGLYVPPSDGSFPSWAGLEFQAFGQVPKHDGTGGWEWKDIVFKWDLENQGSSNGQWMGLELSFDNANITYTHADNEIEDQHVFRDGASWMKVILTVLGKPEAGRDGEAWFDDVTVEETLLPGFPPSLRAVVSAEETLRLGSQLGSDAWAPAQPGNWRVRADVRVQNFDPPAGANPKRLVIVDLDRAVHAIRRAAPGTAPPYRVLVMDAVSQQPLRAFWVGESTDTLAFHVEAPWQTERRVYVYISTEPYSWNQIHIDYVNLVLDTSLNKVLNPGLEGQPPINWKIVGTEHCPGCVVATSPGGPVSPNSQCFRLAVSPELDMDRWFGWEQVNPIPVEPGATYLHAAVVKLQNVQGPHFLAGGFSSDGGSNLIGTIYTWGNFQGTQDWNLKSGLSRAPDDASHAIINMSMHMGEVTGVAWYDGMLFAKTHPGKVYVEDHYAPAPPDLAVWSVNPLVKIFPDDPAPGSSGLPNPISAKSARNEREPIQIAVRSTRAGTFTVEASALILSDGGSSGAALPPVEMFQVGMVPVDIRTPGGGTTADPYWIRPVRMNWYADPKWYNGASDGWAGEWPDPLIPPSIEPASRLTFSLAANRTQPVWLRVSVPEDAQPGVYTGTLTVSGSAGASRTIPISFEVWDFALPPRPRLQAVYEFLEAPALANYEIEKIKDLYRFMAPFRISPGRIFPEPVFTHTGLTVHMDSKDFEDVASLCFDTLRMNAGFTARLFGAQGWQLSLGKKFGYEPRTPAYKALLQSAFSQYHDLLVEQGWDEYYSVYLSDEPFCNDPVVVSDLQYVAGLYRDASGGDLPVYASTWTPCEGLVGTITHWGVGQHGCFPVADMQERQEAGDKLWFTTDGQMALDSPYLAHERLISTYSYAYGLSGFELWGLTFWTHDPWKKGWHRYDTYTYEGTDLFRVRWNNGDGYVAYPGSGIGRDGLIASIRLEAVRDGVDDYDYYRILEDLINAKPECDDIPDPRGALAAARALVWIPNEGGLSPYSILPDPDAVYRVRERVAQQIVWLLTHECRPDEEPVSESR